MICFAFYTNLLYFYRYNNIAMLESQKLALFIRTHRKTAGLSQLQLAEMSGVGKTAIFDIEKGKATIQLDTLRKILTVLNIKVQLISPLINPNENNEKS